MAEINLSADNVRAALTEALGRLRKANADYFEMLEKGISSSPLPIAIACSSYLRAETRV